MSETTENQEAGQKQQSETAMEEGTSGSTDQPSTPSKSSPGKNVSPSKKENDMASKAFMHLAAGKRHLAVSDFKNAVTDLEEACRLLGEMFGEDGDQCADGYYYYGLALLDLARQESGVLGEMPESEGSDEDKTDSDEQKEESEKDENSEEGAEEKGDETEEKEDENEEKEEEVENGEQDEKAEDETEGETKENGEQEKEENPEEAAVEKGTENEQEEEEEDEVSNLQLAWEVLELAKVIFTRRRSEGLEIEKKLSMVFMKLGEVSLESENYAQSIEDLKNCLETRKKIYPPYHRDIAEVHYQLATALQFDKQYDLAIEHYHGAMKVLEDKITYLNEVIQRRDAKEKGEEVSGDDGSEERAKDAFYREEDEIEEIKSLFPDLREKITDTKDLKSEHLKKLAMASARLFAGEGSSGAGCSSSSGGGGGASSSSSSAPYNPSMLGFDEDFSKPSAAAVAAASPTKPAVSISHLVKRKRKPEEDAQEETEEKKAKVVNGQT